ncbi:MAG TPA: homoserine kinase [Blastocatellia bacterium]|jgi:homoserine kinase|nr:homoserine kinase [Blastocatellia bacterium]HAF23346.1 homoserine kinase [Blastocatellia bacterium]
MSLASGAVDIIEDSAEAGGKSERSFSVRVPASTSNLGAGFDSFSLALQLYLTVSARVIPEASEICRVTSSGEGSTSGLLSRTEDNLIFRAMSFAAAREGWTLPPVQLDVHNELPLGRGLGSSAAAIVAGLTLSSLICDQKLSPATVLRYALEMEGHADNVAAAYHGGWIVSCVKTDGNVLAVKRPWPEDLKVIVVSPDALLKTTETRSALPATVERDDAVHNLQRVALFGAAVEGGDYDLLWDAMQDRMHQPYRQSLVPGLAEALATKPQPGLVGVALSGSGPSVIALALDHLPEIGEAIANSFRSRGMPATVRLLEVDREGQKTMVARAG